MGETQGEQEGLTRYSRATTAAGANPASAFVTPSNRFDDFQYKFVDKNIDLKRAINGILAQGKEVADNIDAYLQEKPFHGCGCG